jgi:hypothetical protein
VTARFDTIRLRGEGPDRVAVEGVKGEPPPPTLKVAVNHLGGFRNGVTFVLAGLDIEAKAQAVEAALWQAVGGRDSFAETDVELVRWDRPDPASHPQSMAHLRVTVKDSDPSRVGRSFSGAAVELALAHYPGFFLTAPPGDASPYAVYWPGKVTPEQVPARIHLDGETWEVPSDSLSTSERSDDEATDLPAWNGDGDTVRVPLGLVAGARSGDKGGDANVGVWVRNPAAFPWLAAWLTEDRLAELIPETEGLVIRRHMFPNLAAVNFVIEGMLGEGVASSSAIDPQAKSLGEYLRARHVDLPRSFLPS